MAEAFIYPKSMTQVINHWLIENVEDGAYTHRQNVILEELSNGKFKEMDDLPNMVVSFTHPRDFVHFKIRWFEEIEDCKKNKGNQYLHLIQMKYLSSIHVDECNISFLKLNNEK